jgi:hypothetical protein
LEDKMSQYHLLRHVVAVGTLGALATAGCFVVDDKKDDDGGDAGAAGEDTGGSGGSGTGGSSAGKGGSKATGGSSTGGASGSATGGSGGACVQSGGTCVDPTDCCAVLTGTGYCVAGTCADACEVDSECDTNCCAELTNGSFACGPAELCDDTPGGTAVMKFCNELYLGGTTAAPLTVTLAGASATAVSGTCSPVVPNPCVPFPAGPNPTVVLTDPSDGSVVAMGSFNVTVTDGQEIFLDATIDDTTMMPTVDAYEFPATDACSATDPLAVMLETKSARFSLPDHSVARLKAPASRDTRAALPAFTLRK